MIVDRVTDLRRGLDYLETRTDIDTTRIAALAPSAGAALGLILGAVEPRYRAFVFVGAGLTAATVASLPRRTRSTSRRTSARQAHPAGPLRRGHAARTTTEPLFKLLPEPKQLTLYDGGHVPSLEVMMSASSAWLEAHLGPVGREP